MGIFCAKTVPLQPESAPPTSFQSVVRSSRCPFIVAPRCYATTNECVSPNIALVWLTRGDRGHPPSCSSKWVLPVLSAKVYTPAKLLESRSFQGNNVYNNITLPCNSLMVAGPGYIRWTLFFAGPTCEHTSLVHQRRRHTSPGAQ